MATTTTSTDDVTRVPDLDGYIAGFRTLLKPGGVVIAETPYVVDMVEKCEFDTVYHEHLYCHSLTALTSLFGRQGLKVLDVVAIHRRVAPPDCRPRRQARRPVALSRRVARRGAHAGRRPSGVVPPLRRAGRRPEADPPRDPRRPETAGQTAGRLQHSAKGSTLLNCFGIGPELLDFVVDRSGFKPGLYARHEPADLPAERLLEAMPDYVLLLTWNFADEILAQQAEYRSRGGRFIVPVPN